MPDSGAKPANSGVADPAPSGAASGAKDGTSTPPPNVFFRGTRGKKCRKIVQNLDLGRCTFGGSGDAGTAGVTEQPVVELPANGGGGAAPAAPAATADAAGTGGEAALSPGELLANGGGGAATAAIAADAAGTEGESPSTNKKSHGSQVKFNI